MTLYTGYLVYDYLILFGVTVIVTDIGDLWLIKILKLSLMTYVRI